jgi:TolB-like protein/Tfp pilus assembly protein PilF
VRSIAVLPLVSLSADPGQEYFADGMTDALITELARVPGLSVVSRGSVIRFKGSQRSTPEIARELRVDAVLEGTVQREGGVVKVNAQLVHGESDRHLWADSYERAAGDVLRLQGDVARAVAEAIVGRLPEDARARFSRRAVDPEAHDAFLRGRYFWGRRSEEALARGIASLERAISIDPAYAPAWAALADCYLYVRRRPLEALPMARDAALRAVSLDPALAEGHVALGNVRLLLDWDWRAAEDELARAAAADPASVEAHHQRSHLDLVRGRLDDSLRESERALELDPLSLSINGHLAYHWIHARDFAAAARQARRTLELDERYGTADEFLGLALLFQGKPEEALAALRRASALDPQNMSAVAATARAEAASGRRAQARATLGRLVAERERRYVPESELAAVHLALGDVEEAFEWLDRAVRERDAAVVYLAVDPTWDAIRSDGRFQALLRRVGLR